MALQTVELPSENLDCLGEVGSLDVIAGIVRSHGLDPGTLVYAGFDGESTRDTGELPPKDSTYGYTHEEYFSNAELIDKYNEVDGNAPTPLMHAFKPGREVPALIAYDMSMLSRSGYEENVWLPSPGNTLAEAARLVIFFSSQS